MEGADPRDALIADLRSIVEQQAAALKLRDEEILSLKAQLAKERALRLTAQAKIVELEAKIVELAAKIAQNSQNSSKPPSSDPPGTPRRQRAVRSKAKRARKKRGAQPNHKPQQRELFPPERVTNTQRKFPKRCKKCKAPLTEAQQHGAPRRHQVVDLPPIVPPVDEYQLFACRCGCGTITRAKLPKGVPLGNFGPGVVAAATNLTGPCGASKRVARLHLEEVLGVELSLGTVSALERVAVKALEPAYIEAKAYVEQSTEVNADETSWRENKEKAWLWVAAGAMAAFFAIAKTRGAESAKALLGKFAGVLGSDRWSAYSWYDVALRQLCWAHLDRDFAGWVLLGGQAAELGKALGKQAAKLFRWWNKRKDGECDLEKFQKKMKEVEREVVRLLREAEKCPQEKVAGMAKNMLSMEAAMWTFVRVPGVEPTNNRAERAIRPGVMLRKRSFGTDSERGSRFVERMLTVQASMKMQGRSTYHFIRESVAAHFAKKPGPKLILPAPTLAQSSLSAGAT